jgi:hypothetical protein
MGQNFQVAIITIVSDQYLQSLFIFALRTRLTRCEFIIYSGLNILATIAAQDSLFRLTRLSISLSVLQVFFSYGASRCITQNRTKEREAGVSTIDYGLGVCHPSQPVTEKRLNGPKEKMDFGSKAGCGF